MEESINYTHLVEAIRSAGLERGIICLHSSLKSFGVVEGGADTVLRAFLDSGCTLLVPTFTYACNTLPPAGRHILQKGWDDSASPNPVDIEAYDQHSTMITKSAMGAIPARLLEMPGQVRGLHPLNSFAALGPLAGDLIATQTLVDVYGPYKAAYAHPNAYLLLMGVDLTKATPIHLAEELSGRRLNRRWARNVDSPSVQEVAVGSCSEGFNRFAPLVGSIETRLMVGKSLWRVYPLAAFIETITAAIIQNPQMVHCDDADCQRCNDGVKGGPLL